MENDTDNTASPYETEVPYAPERLATLLSFADGAFTKAEQLVPSSKWSGEDLEAIRSHVLKAAARVLTDKQLAVLTGWIAGESLTSIGERLGISQQTASTHLNGHHREGGGALKKLQAALVEDDALLALLNDIRTRRNDPDVRTLVVNWFAAGQIVRPQRADRFVPLVVALMLYLLASDPEHPTRTVRHDDLLRVLPPSIITQAIPTLRALRMVATDGRTYELISSPADVMKAAIEERSR